MRSLLGAEGRGGGRAMLQCSVKSRNYRCPNPARAGGPMCQACHQYRVEYMRRYRERRREYRRKKALLPRTCYSCRQFLPPQKFHVWEAKVGCHEICKACLSERTKQGIARTREKRLETTGPLAHINPPTRSGR